MSTSNIAKRRTKPNYTYAILSVSLVLFLLGFFGLVLLHAQELIQLYKEQVNIIVELDDQLTEVQIRGVEQLLKQQEAVLDTSIHYISKDEAALLMQEEFGEDFQDLGLPNPFYEMYTFNVRAGTMQADSLEQLQMVISEFPGVNAVYYQENVIDEISNNLKKLGYLALVVSLFFFVVAVTLVHNTIRLALYSNRFLIKNMQLVGASWGFISRPYLLRALGHGFIASVLAIAALSAMLFWVRRDIPQLLLVEDAMTFVYLLCLLIPIGMLLYGISTYQVVHRQLTMRVDDLY
ncbi:MAG TPA: permease-like cell division protein FtsX [Saprospiraceae bacterium]|nr:permease-like cell division protein FtsX [Saprospiraceae bacterium]